MAVQQTGNARRATKAPRLLEHKACKQYGQWEEDRAQPEQ